jgi:hypothetical protein
MVITFCFCITDIVTMIVTSTSVFPYVDVSFHVVVMEFEPNADHLRRFSTPPPAAQEAQSPWSPLFAFLAFVAI